MPLASVVSHWLSGWGKATPTVVVARAPTGPVTIASSAGPVTTSSATGPAIAPSTAGAVTLASSAGAVVASQALTPTVVASQALGVTLPATLGPLTLPAVAVDPSESAQTGPTPAAGTAGVPVKAQAQQIPTQA